MYFYCFDAPAERACMRASGTINTCALARRAFDLIGGKGAWAAVDPIGGDIAHKITQSLRDDGTLLVYSSMTDVTSNVGIPDLLYRGVKVGCGTCLCVQRLSAPAAISQGSARCLFYDLAVTRL